MHLTIYFGTGTVSIIYSDSGVIFLPAKPFIFMVILVAFAKNMPSFSEEPAHVCGTHVLRFFSSRPQRI